jgi:anti-sigma factor RsiW
MTCHELVEYLMGYLEGDLDSETRRAFETHLDECPSCVGYMKSYEQTVKVGRSARDGPEGPAPDEAPEELVDAILAARKTL